MRPKRAGDGARQRAHEQRLAQAGHAFDQHVAAGEQRAQHRVDHVALPDQRLGRPRRAWPLRPLPPGRIVLVGFPALVPSLVPLSKARVHRAARSLHRRRMKSRAAHARRPRSRKRCASSGGISGERGDARGALGLAAPAKSGCARAMRRSAASRAAATRRRAQALRPVVAAARAQVVEQPPPRRRRVGRAPGRSAARCATATARASAAPAASAGRGVLQRESPYSDRRSGRRIDLQLGCRRQADELPEELGVVLRADRAGCARSRGWSSAVTTPLPQPKLTRPALLVRVGGLQRSCAPTTAEQHASFLSVAASSTGTGLRRARRRAGARRRRRSSSGSATPSELRFDDEMAPGLTHATISRRRRGVERLAAVRQQQHAGGLSVSSSGSERSSRAAQAHALGEALGGEELAQRASPEGPTHSLRPARARKFDEEPRHAAADEREQRRGGERARLSAQVALYPCASAFNFIGGRQRAARRRSARQASTSAARVRRWRWRARSTSHLGVAREQLHAALVHELATARRDRAGQRVAQLSVALRARAAASARPPEAFPARAPCRRARQAAGRLRRARRATRGSLRASHQSA